MKYRIWLRQPAANKFQAIAVMFGCGGARQ